ncbi:cell division protein FtsW [Saccharopolyspora antimicrobica]|uniref:Probable peptidoglycan glycosyltransferase FtsW n=1 Tax=Saccharopolyspora antimicrobica TaxID=455193 RepID=A0A1I5LJV0_9PSEU|nr:putative lipid II flippase FtsW [Saccharopolyspora antimicrobica]RKT86086.1 cell division-specific peptidoglycan biosynthesis regulator FtsW [Saccharopolyspora antimicrobica]SFO97021.1 cell division protein FtsW [Saccharopolyspora antimicrobica]
MPTATKTARGARKRAGLTVLSPLTAWLTRPLASFHLLLAVFGLLTVFGLVMVLSASSVDSFNKDGSSYTVFTKQVLFCIAGLVLFYAALRVPVKLMRRYSLILLTICLGLLALVLTPLGANVNGAQSWFIVAGVSFQPVEFAKVSFALWGAHVLVTKRGLMNQYRHLLVPVVPAALLMFTLVMLQPDLGSTITLFVVLLALLWFAGAPLRLFLMALLGAVTAGVTLAMVADYRMARITAFMDPMSDPTGNGFQARQALFALADGGLFGRGLGQGWSKWQYLPNVHNDFIFAVIGEELGFVGCAIVLALYGTTAYVGMRIAFRNTDPWIRLVSATLTTFLVGQAIINVGYVVGLLPTTGLPLPLISSGGSSVVTSMLVFGLLANFARHEPEAIAALRSLGPGRVGKLLRLPTPAPYRPPAKRRPARPTPRSRPGAKGSGAAATRRGGGDTRARGARSGPGSRAQTRGGHR